MAIANPDYISLLFTTTVGLVARITSVTACGWEAITTCDASTSAPSLPARWGWIVPAAVVAVTMCDRSRFASDSLSSLLSSRVPTKRSLLSEFDGFRTIQPQPTIRARAEQQIKARQTTLLFSDDNAESRSQIMWRLALPLAALNLALLAIPLGAVNPRMGRSGNILVAGLVGLLYMNLINLSRGWIRNEQLGFEVGLWLVHAIFLLVMVFMMWRKLRIKAPEPPATS